MQTLSLLVLLLAAPLFAADPADLLAADRAFAADTAARGLDGWMRWFADDAHLNSPRGHIQGKTALRKFYSDMFRPGFSLKWEPFHASLSADGTLGYTLGTSVSEHTDPSGNVQKRNGRYLTIWRKQKDGSWKAETDIGN